MITAYDNLRYATFEEWKRQGYFVRRGEKSYMVDERSFDPLFSEKQVEQRRSSYQDLDYDLDPHNILDGCLPAWTPPEHFF